MPTNINIKDIQGQAQLLSIPELESYLLTQFDPDAVDTSPSTEEELYECYYNNTDYLYQYLRKVVGSWLFPLSNEIRAMMGHLADYRIANENGSKKNLDKAYGHFRRLTLDAFKILCDEFDKSLSRQMKRQYSYDYRNVIDNYLGHFSSKYISAKQKYIEAQCQEKLGSDYGEHNVFTLYHQAAVDYIELKQYYQENKQAIQKVRRKANIKKIATFLGALFGLGIAIVDYIFG